MITLAEHAARAAGDVLMRYYGRASLVVETKSASDFVTEADRAAEDVVRELLQKECPEHGLWLEESGRLAGLSDYTWVVDPLDGTTNFVHRYPCFAVSIGVLKAEQPVLGVVYDPLRNEMFSCERGDGIKLNGVGLGCSRSADPAQALLCTGFPFRVRQQLDPYLQMFRLVFERCAGMRRAGSAALDLAYVASGRADGFWELGLSPWDMAAGGLMVSEGGGLVSDFHGGPDWLLGGDILAANGPAVHAMLAECAARVWPTERPPRA